MLIERTYYARTAEEKDEIVKNLEKEYHFAEYMATIKSYQLNNGTWKIELTYSSLD